MRRFLAVLLTVSFLINVMALAAVRGKSAKYVGGTILIYAGTEKEREKGQKPVDGKWDLEDEYLVFTPKKKGLQPLRVPYKKIESLEYGQKVGRRVGAAIGVAMISPVGLLFLFSKKRKHFLTIGFKDEQDKLQGAVFELAKGIVPESLSTLEASCGKKVEYESEEARKHAQKN